jgi:uncharacterized protein YkwD
MEARGWVWSIAAAALALGAGCSDPSDNGAFAMRGVGGAIGGGIGGQPAIPGTSATPNVACSSPSAAGMIAPPIPTGVAGTGAAGAPAPMGGAPMMPPRAGTGAMMMMGAAGSGMPPTNPASCPAPPADAPPQTVAALAAVNNYRVPAGSGCATMVAEINKAATAHCAYYAQFAMDDMCVANPHLEVMGCTGFTGATPGDRMKAAGYSSFGGGEVMAFVNSAQGSVDTWVNSVWHRVPILDPWTTHLGYGSSATKACDTIDFGRGTTPAPANTVVVYPYDGQLNIPVAFNGQYEGPMPPAPASGWPSSAPISVYAQKIAVTAHVLTKDGDATPIEHVWLDSQAEIVAQDMRRSLTNVVFMYANMPFEPNTKYRVKVSGTYTGGALLKEWTFTTGAAATRPGRRP